MEIDRINTMDIDKLETDEWIESLRAVAESSGRERARFLLGKIIEWGKQNDVVAPFTPTTFARYWALSVRTTRSTSLGPTWASSLNRLRSSANTVSSS